jgi:SMODS-associated and fused to various effectors sensor domain
MTTHVKKPRTTAKRHYTDRTLKLLWGRSAGRCAVPECRVELFAEATDYDPIVVIGDIAHVNAAADDGPRAEPGMTPAERNAYENLILLCKNCHTRVDGQPGANPVARLHAVKDAHEAWVRASLPERGASRTGWTAVALRGDHPFDLATVAEAVSPDFVADQPQILQVPTGTEDWAAVDRAIAARARDLLTGDDVFDRRLAIFPIAPVSACFSLGYHLTSRPHVRLFQHHRDSQSWSWPRKPAPANDLAVSGPNDRSPTSRAATFIFHLTAAITDEVLLEAGAPLDCRIDFRVPSPSTGWLQSPEQIVGVAHAARTAFEHVMRMLPNASEWHIFYAGPAPVAVAVGQQVNPTMYPVTQLYEYRHKETPKYKPSVRLC